MKKRNASTSLSLVPRDQLERQALMMRRRARNADMERGKMRRRVFTALVGASAAFGTGFIVGRRVAQGQPTQYSGVDIELVVGGVTALGGILMQSRSNLAKLGEFFESGGMGVLSYYAGSRGEKMGSDSVAAAA